MTAKEETLKPLLIEAYKTAKHSRDTLDQNGAVIFRADSWCPTLVCAASNNFPSGVREDKNRILGPLKTVYNECAERAAIYKAARHGASLQNCILICPLITCPDCARAIISSGIKFVFGHKQMIDRASVNLEYPRELAFEMLREANVSVELYDGELNLNFTLRLEGKLWTP